MKSSFRYLLLIGAVLLPLNASAEEPSFINSILQNIGEQEDSFNDSFVVDDSIYKRRGEIIRYAPGPSKSPLSPKRTKLHELVDGIKAVAGVGQKQHVQRLLSEIERSYDNKYIVPKMIPCSNSRIITRPAKIPTLLPDTADYLYFDGSDRSARSRTYRFGSKAIPLDPGKRIENYPEEKRLPIYLADIIGITCLPTYVRMISDTEFEFHEGEAAWQGSDGSVE